MFKLLTFTAHYSFFRFPSVSYIVKILLSRMHELDELDVMNCLQAYKYVEYNLGYSV